MMALPTPTSPQAQRIMSDSVHKQFWNEQLEPLITEIARQATVAHVPLIDPGVVEAVLRNDEASCGSTNPMAFRKLREALMMIFIVQKMAYDDLGPLETEAMIAEIRAALAPRFTGKLGGPAAG
jgi:hypothetical protein